MPLGGGGRVGLYPGRAVVQDSIHGSIFINELEYSLLQTPVLRRLHGIKQLGLLHLVYPSATHSRLSHSLGVMHIASRLAERAASIITGDARLCGRLMKRCGSDEEATLIQLVRLAGMLHDIGHYPYSHVTEEAIDFSLSRSDGGWDRLFKAARVYEELRNQLKLNDGVKHHEIMGYMMARKLVEKMEEIGVDDKRGLLIEAAVSSLWSTRRAGPLLEALNLEAESAYIIRDILSHDVVDADRLDYLRRDASYTGVIYGFTDFDRIYNGVRVRVPHEEEGRARIEYDISAMQSIEDVYDARFKMYRTVYHHHKSTALLIAYHIALLNLAEDWETYAPRDLQDYDLVGDLMNPQRLPELTVFEGVLFDDSSIDSAIKSLAVRGPKDAKRWARALLHERHLLPISLIKRQDELLLVVTESLGSEASVEDAASLARDLVRVVSTSVDELREWASKVAREAGIVGGEVEVEARLRRIGGGASRAYSGYSSIYLKSLDILAGIDILHVYMYSHEEGIHRELYKARRRIRERFRQYLKEKAACIASGAC